MTSMITMEKMENRIYIVEKVLFQGELFTNHRIRVMYDSRDREWYVICPDQTMISADSLKKIYKARKNIVEHYDKAETYCYLNDKPCYWY